MVTTAFGASDLGEGITNYNLIRDTIFSGNQGAYDLTSNIFMYTSIVGSLISGGYAATHTKFIDTRSTPRMSSPNSSVFNKNSKVLTYYGNNGEMKYSMGLFEKNHRWIHWHTEMPHSKPINNIIKFIWELIKRGF